MRIQRKLNYCLALTTLLGVGVLGFTHYSASAQNEPGGQPPPPGRGFGGGQGMRMMMGGGASIAATADFVYVLRGNTVYQMKAADLSLVGQKNLPMPPGGGPGAPPPPGQ